MENNIQDLANSVEVLSRFSIKHLKRLIKTLEKERKHATRAQEQIPKDTIMCSGRTSQASTNREAIKLLKLLILHKKGKLNAVEQ